MRLLRRVLLALVREAPPVMSDAQWSRFVQVLFPLVVQARRGSIAVAAELLQREALRFDAPVPDVLPEPFYDLRALDDALTRTVRVPLSEHRSRGFVEVAAQAAVERHVQMAGREATIVAVESAMDSPPTAPPVAPTAPSERPPTSPPRVPLGWARRLTGAENCAFCVMLASRGAVYRSRATAGGMRKWHDGCDCEIVPVYDLTDWPGLDGFVEAKRRYAEALKHVDGRGDNVRKALARDLYADPFRIPSRAA